MFIQQSPPHNFESIERLQYMNVMSQQVANLLGNLLEKKYPNIQETDEIFVNDLLEWDLWPGFLHIYSECSFVSYIIIF